MALAFPTKAAAQNASASIDLVETFGRRYASITSARERIDLERIRLRQEGRSDLLIRSEDEELSDEMYAIKDIASCMKATGIPGAMFQVALACDAASSLYELIEGANELDAAALMRTVRRCLYSVLGVLADHSGVAPFVVGAEWIMSEGLDPHVMVDAAIEPVAAEKEC